MCVCNQLTTLFFSFSILNKLIEITVQDFFNPESLNLIFYYEKNMYRNACFLKSSICIV